MDLVNLAREMDELRAEYDEVERRIREEGGVDGVRDGENLNC